MRVSARSIAVLVALPLIVAAFVVACSDSDSKTSPTASGAFGQSGGSNAIDSVEFAPSPQPTPDFFTPDVEAREESDQSAQSAAVAQDGAASPPPGVPNTGADADLLQIADRQIISTGYLALTVEAVPAAVQQVQGVATSLGGFMEHLSQGEAGPNAIFAEMTIRVPQDQFDAAMTRLRDLGRVTSESVNAQDVSEQFIDLEARLNSAQREEVSLLALLDRAQDVSDILAIERELNRVRGEIERMQGQLNALERRVALSTINLSLNTPSSVQGSPPFAQLTVATGDVTDAAADAGAFVEGVDGRVEQSILFTEDGEASASLSLIVPVSAFDEALAAFEDMGDVRSKQLVEGGPRPIDPKPLDQSGQADVTGASSLDPDTEARINLQLVQRDGGISTGLLAAIIAPIGGVLLLVAGAVVWRIARRRRA